MQTWVVLGSCRDGWQKAFAAAGVAVAAEVAPGQGLDAARAHGATGVLVDDAMAGPEELLALVRAGHAVVLVGGRPDQEAIRRAMVLGIRDYVDEPFTPEDLARAVAAAGHLASGGPAAGRLVAVCGGRGGSGRSSIALNLAVALGLLAERPVAAVDLCLDFGGLVTLAGAEAERTLADACRPSGPLDPDVLIQLMTAPPRLPVRILASPRDPSLAAEIAGAAVREGGRDYLAEILTGLLGRFPWVVADLPPAPGEGWLAALDRAEAAVVVVTPDVPGLAAAARLLRLLDALGVEPARRKVVLNAPWGPARVPAGTVADLIGAPVDLAIAFDPSVGAALDAGRPLVGRRHRGPFARAIAALAQQLAGTAVAVPRAG